jgi:hypothetical protein
MAIYTFADTKSAANGTTQLKLASGILVLGESLDVTAGELTILNPLFDMRAGTVVTTPTNLPSLFKRNDKAVPQSQRSLRRQMARERAGEIEQSGVDIAPMHVVTEEELRESRKKQARAQAQKIESATK